MKLNYLFIQLLFLFSCVQEHNEVKTNSKDIKELKNVTEKFSEVKIRGVK